MITHVFMYDQQGFDSSFIFFHLQTFSDSYMIFKAILIAKLVTSHICFKSTRNLLIIFQLLKHFYLFPLNLKSSWKTSAISVK